MVPVQTFLLSPLIKGMMFPTISGHSLKVFPAPEIAWYVLTTTFVAQIRLHAAKQGV